MSALRRYYTALSRYRRGKGFGIHSPFAFHFVLRVLKERAAYYFYDDIDEYRQLASAGRSRMKGRKRPLVSRKNARLLFRIVNCFQPSAVLAFGSSYGVSSRVILGVSRKTHLWLCEPAELMPVVAEVLGGEMRRVTAGECAGELIGQAAQEMGECPFVVVDYLRDEDIPPVAAYLGLQQPSVGRDDQFGTADAFSTHGCNLFHQFHHFPSAQRKHTQAVFERCDFQHVSVCHRSFGHGAPQAANVA